MRFASSMSAEARLNPSRSLDGVAQGVDHRVSNVVYGARIHAAFGQIQRMPGPWVNSRPEIRSVRTRLTSFGISHRVTATRTRREQQVFATWLPQGT